jgi:hypothetical protein
MSPPSTSRPTRREALKAGALALLGASSCTRPASADLGVGKLPQEPLEIGRDPQLLFDLHVVDCTWALEEKQAPVKRVAHGAEKHALNPLLKSEDHPSHFWIARDDGGPFRMWYQSNWRIPYPQGRQKGQPQFGGTVAYAESQDGIHWERPPLDLFKGHQGKLPLPRNCILHRPGSDDLKPFNTPALVEAPPQDRRGYRYLLLYLGRGPDHPRGIRLIGSHDGIHFDLKSDTLLAPIGSDHHNTVVYDPQREEYAMYLRAKDIYLAAGQRGGYETIELGDLGERLNTGQSRRGVARMASKDLWTQWSSRPQTIFVPDELDAETNYNFVYGMPVRYWAGIYWGFVQMFRMNDFMHVQLATSRDGIRFERLPTRPMLIEYGPDGAWDDTMHLACPNWIDVGDQWWLYYNGHDGPHETAQRDCGIGLAKFRKEGFVSLRGPAGGGVVCTRQIRWPGGSLAINADARQGELRVRVSDPLRKPVAGYNYEDCIPFTGDSVRQNVTWGGRSLDALKGQAVRLEFYLKNADLFTFCAVEKV